MAYEFCGEQSLPNVWSVHRRIRRLKLHGHYFSGSCPPENPDAPFTGGSADRPQATINSLAVRTISIRHRTGIAKVYQCGVPPRTFDADAGRRGNSGTIRVPDRLRKHPSSCRDRLPSLQSQRVIAWAIGPPSKTRRYRRLPLGYSARTVCRRS